MSETPRGHLRTAVYIPGAGLQPRPHRAWVLTDKGSGAVAAHPSCGDHNHDHRSIATNYDHDGYTTVSVTTSDGTHVEYHQRPDGGSFPRVVGHRDAGATHSVDAGGGVRRGWRMVLEWAGLSRLAGNIGGQLVREWWHV